MASYLEAQSPDELLTELIEDTTTPNHVEVIENVIDSLAQDQSAMVSHAAEGGYLWKFQYGSIEVFVQLTGITDEDTIRLSAYNVPVNLTVFVV